MTWSDVVVIVVMIAFAVPLIRIDLREHRLPNTLTAALFATELGALLLASVLNGSWGRFGAALLGALAMAALYALLALVPGGMGFGDVKLAVSIGLVTAWWSWPIWFLAVLAAFVFGAIAAVWCAIRERTLTAAMAFGPSMLIGWAFAALCVVV